MARSRTTFVKGEAKGRQKGVVNKTTRDIKEAYRMLIEKNLDNMTTWLDRIAEKNPERAIAIINDLSEYVIPKLARAEIDHSNKDGSLKQNTIVVTDEEAKNELKKLING